MLLVYRQLPFCLFDKIGVDGGEIWVNHLVQKLVSGRAKLVKPALIGKGVVKGAVDRQPLP